MPELDTAIGRARVSAWSKAGLGTAIAVSWSKKQRIAFDMGTRLSGADGARHVFLSHCHLDHCAAMFAHARTRAMLGARSATKYYCPAPCAPILERARVAFEELDAMSPGGDSDSECDDGADECGHGVRLAMEIVGLTAGDEVDLGGGMRVRAFATAHRVPSLGFGVFRTVRRGLLPRFHEILAGDEEGEAVPLLDADAAKAALHARRGALRDALRAAKAAGEETNIVEHEVSCVYTGDTTFPALLAPSCDWIWRAKLWIGEMTFVGDDVTEAKALAKGHVHVAQLARAVAAGKFDAVGAVLFVHFSGRYRATTIGAALARALGGAPTGAAARTALLGAAPQPSLLARTHLALAAWGVADGAASIAYLDAAAARPFLLPPAAPGGVERLALAVVCERRDPAVWRAVAARVAADAARRGPPFAPVGLVLCAPAPAAVAAEAEAEGADAPPSCARAVVVTALDGSAREEPEVLEIKVDEVERRFERASAAAAAAAAAAVAAAVE